VEYVVVVHEAEEGGYWGEVPALEGCFAQGETVEELLEDAKAAAQSHIEALRVDGQPVPSPRGILIATVSLPEQSVA